MLVNFAGAQIGGYTLHAEIGRGGMGRVYLATRPDTSQQFAIKVVNGLTTGDSRFEQRFWREISVANRLVHPAILPIIASGQETDGTLFMVMPLVQGGALKDFLQNHPMLTPAQARALVTRVGEALDYAHAQGIVHRDVKPHNIMLLDDGQWCLTDFGIAALASVEETVSNLTSTGATLGTFAYMSPEQISGGDLDGRADLYALGVVMYQALVGRLPFASDNTATILSQQLHSQPIAPHLINPDFPAEVEAALDKALAKKPADRFQTGAELAEAFGRAFDALSPELQDLPLVTGEQINAAGTLTNILIPTQMLSTEPQKRSNRRLLLIGAAALLLAIAACAVIVMPLQAKLADAQGTAAALGSRTPIIVTQVVTNAAGQTVIIQVTAAQGTPSRTSGLTPSPSPSRAAATLTATSRPSPVATLAPTVVVGGATPGQGGATLAATSVPGSGATNVAATNAVATSPGNSGNAGTPGSGSSGGNSGGSNSGGNSGGGNSGGGNNGGGNGGGNGHGKP